MHFQNKIYERAIQLAKTEWVIYLDIDEFLFLPNYSNIGKFLLDIPGDVGGLAIYQNIFGSCGHVKSPDGLVVENYTTRNEDDIKLDKNEKYRKPEGKGTQTQQ